MVGSAIKEIGREGMRREGILTTNILDSQSGKELEL